MSGSEHTTDQIVTRDSAPFQRAPVIVDRLLDAHDGGWIELNWSTPFQLLVATILSAQSTDKKVNEVTEVLFTKYPTARDYVSAPEAQLQQEIYATGFYRQKTRSLQAMSGALLERHDGEVPLSMGELVALPGVARKTANVVLSGAAPRLHADDPDAGIAVDTHVKRLSRRFGLTDQTDPVKIERDLMAVIPRTQWGAASLVIILHGRRVCDAQRPRCTACVVEDLCPSSQSGGCADRAGQAKGLGAP